MRLRRLAVAAIPLMLLAACSNDTITGPEAQGHARASQATDPASGVNAMPQIGSGALYEPVIEGDGRTPQIGSGALYEPTSGE